MTSSGLLASILALAVVLASARMLLRVRRTAPQARPRAWRTALLLLLQLGSAFLLLRTLVPPPVETGIATLVVATANAGSATVAGPDEHLVALPEAPPLAAAERQPDLASALRAYPAARSLRVVGAGLVARDRDAVQGRLLRFEPAALPRGLVELSAPAQVTTGTGFSVHGRAARVPGGHVELLDPAGQRVDRAALPEGGRFHLRGAARVAGPAGFRLRLLDAGTRVVEETTVPLDVVTPPSLRLLVLAGGPDAELKFLRRWAIDSGARLHTRIQLGGGMHLGDPAIAFDAATLRGFDAAIVDERAWTGLGEARRGALVEAVREGLGLVLRVSGPLPASVRSDLRTVGLHLAPASLATTFALPPESRSDLAAARSGPGTPDAPSMADLSAPLPPLSRAAFRIATDDMQVLLRDAHGEPLAAWRNAGRGRVAAWLPVDTYRLVLSGRGDLHASLWREAIAAVARARAIPAPDLSQEAREGERITLCALPTAVADVLAPDGRATALLVDPAAGPRRCAGYWPRTHGWHVLRTGGVEAPFFVRAKMDAPGLVARHLRESTQSLALSSTRTAAPATTVAGARWPWFLAWLSVSSLLWALERSRPGLRPA